MKQRSLEKDPTTKQPNWRKPKTFLTIPSVPAPSSHVGCPPKSESLQQAWFSGALRATINESSWFINRIKWLWKHCRVTKCMKRTALSPGFLMHLQPRYGHQVLRHKSGSSFSSTRHPETQAHTHSGGCSHGEQGVRVGLKEMYSEAHEIFQRVPWNL